VLQAIALVSKGFSLVGLDEFTGFTFRLIAAGEFFSRLLSSARKVAISAPNSANAVSFRDAASLSVARPEFFAQPLTLSARAMNRKTDPLDDRMIPPQPLKLEGDTTLPRRAIFTQKACQGKCALHKFACV
jgi:hypothetical protein